MLQGFKLGVVYLLSSWMLGVVTASGFMPAFPNDPYINASSVAFLQEYQSQMQKMFAVIGDHQVLFAEVYKHLVSEEAVGTRSYDGIDLPVDNIYNVTGATYKLNILLRMHFNSTNFGGKPYYTIGTATYVCANNSGILDCDSISFIQNPRQVRSIQVIAGYVYTSIKAHMRYQYDQDKIQVTAYETQVVTNTTGRMEYYEFTIPNASLSCQSVLYHNGSKAIMMYFGDDCYQSKYGTTSAWKASAIAHMETPIMIIIVTISIGLVVLVFVVVYKKTISAAPKRVQRPTGYRHFAFVNRLQRHADRSRAFDPTKEELQPSIEKDSNQDQDDNTVVHDTITKDGYSSVLT